MNIKMIVLDLDGTLLRDDKSVSEYTIDTLKKCREKGIKVIFATVRSTTDNVAPPEWFDGCVKKSGAVAYDGSRLVYKRVMPTDSVRALLFACSQAGIKQSLKIAMTVYITLTSMLLKHGRTLQITKKLISLK